MSSGDGAVTDGPDLSVLPASDCELQAQRARRTAESANARHGRRNMIHTYFGESASINRQHEDHACYCICVQSFQLFVSGSKKVTNLTEEVPVEVA